MSNAPTVTEPISDKTDYVDEGVGRLALQFRDKETTYNNLEQLIAVYMGEAQAFENAIDEFSTDVVNLADAAGDQLDLIGEVLNLDRQGLADEVYRAQLRARVLLFRSSGTAQDLIDIFAQYLPAGTAFRLITYDGGSKRGFEIYVEDTITEAVADGAGRVVTDAKAYGINGSVSYALTQPSFAFDGAGSAKFDGSYFFRGSTK